MKLRNGIFSTEQYNGFALDMDNIQAENPSLRGDRIELTYTGRLPAQFRDCENARVSLIVKPRDVRVCLRAYRDKKNLLAVIDAEPPEIENLLDRFFETPNSGSTGLESFWSGVWFAHFVDWKAAQNSA